MELPWKSKIMCIYPWIVRWPLPHCCSVRQAIANMAKVGKMLNLLGFVTLREYLNNAREARIPAHKFLRVSVKISFDFLSCRIFSVCFVAHADAREATGCWSPHAPNFARTRSPLISVRGGMLALWSGVSPISTRDRKQQCCCRRKSKVAMDGYRHISHDRN